MLSEYHNDPATIPELDPSSKWIVCAVAAFAITCGLLSGYGLFF